MTTPDQQNSHDTHRRETRWQIILPFFGGVVLIVGLMIAAALTGRVPVNAAANTMLTVLILCPLAICLLPIYLLLAVAMVGLNRAHNAVSAPLHRLEDLSAMLRDRTYLLRDNAARATINLSVRFAPLDKLIFSFFDRPAHDEDDDE